MQGERMEGGVPSPESTNPPSTSRLVKLGKLSLAQEDLTDPSSSRVIRASGFDINSVSEPLDTGDFDANINILNGTEAPTTHDFVLGAIYAGVHIGNPEAKPWARLSPAYLPEDSMLMITGNFLQTNGSARRLSLRLMPDAWEKSALQTPYTVHETEGRLELTYRQDDQFRSVGSFKELLPIDGIADVYMRGERAKGDNGIVINPIMSCPHRCHFCSRQYDSVNRGDAEGRTPLMVFSPREMVDHTLNRLPDIDWATVQRLSLVTGSFNTFEEMTKYISELSDELRLASNGQFSPGPHTAQEILVLTHLARTPEHFKELKQLGVSLQDTIEVIDDDVRREIMPRAVSRAVPKYHYDFEEIVDSVPDAIDILGKENYRATVILGLDDQQTTVNGFKLLQEGGLQRLYTPVFQPYGYQDHKLYRMRFDELLTVRRTADALFSRVY